MWFHWNRNDIASGSRRIVMERGVRHNRSIDTDVLSAGFARLLSAGHLRRYVTLLG
jgi:hypothetical protein